MKGFLLELSIVAWGPKPEWRGTGPKKKLDDIFSHPDIIDERDGQTDGQTPDDSKDRTCASFARQKLKSQNEITIVGKYQYHDQYERQRVC